MAVSVEAGEVEPETNPRNQSSFRWEIQRFVDDCCVTEVEPVVNGRLQSDYRNRLAKLLQKHRLYREALNAHKLFHRAVHWSITRERITFSIERHPQHVVLFQTWAIDVRAGTFVKTREKFIGLQRSTRLACSPAH